MSTRPEHELRLPPGGVWVVTATYLRFWYGNTYANAWKPTAKHEPSQGRWKVIRPLPGPNNIGVMNGVVEQPIEMRPQRLVRVGVRFNGIFARPTASDVTVSCLRMAGAKDITLDKKMLIVEPNQRGVTVHVDPHREFPHFDRWTLRFGGPANRFLAVGEYNRAKDAGMTSGDSEVPDILISSEFMAGWQHGQFVGWDIEVRNGKDLRLAIDFITGVRGPQLCGSLRLNSRFQPAIPVQRPPPWE